MENILAILFVALCLFAAWHSVRFGLMRHQALVKGRIRLLQASQIAQKYLEATNSVEREGARVIVSTSLFYVEFLDEVSILTDSYIKHHLQNGYKGEEEPQKLQSIVKEAAQINVELCEAKKLVEMTITNVLVASTSVPILTISYLKYKYFSKEATKKKRKNQKFKPTAQHWVYDDIGWGHPIRA